MKHPKRLGTEGAAKRQYWGDGGAVAVALPQKMLGLEFRGILRHKSFRVFRAFGCSLDDIPFVFILPLLPMILVHRLLLHHRGGWQLRRRRHIFCLDHALNRPKEGVELGL